MDEGQQGFHEGGKDDSSEDKGNEEGGEVFIFDVEFGFDVFFYIGADIEEQGYEGVEW